MLRQFKVGAESLSLFINIYREVLGPLVRKKERAATGCRKNPSIYYDPRPLAE
jgi:hypothetical protein